MMSGSKWASTITHSFSEHSLNTITWVSYWAWTRTTGINTSFYPSSEDLTTNSFHRNRRLDSSPWQVFNVTKKRTSVLTDYLLFLIWVIDRLKAWHWAFINFKFLNLSWRWLTFDFRYMWSILILNFNIALATCWSISEHGRRCCALV